MQEGLSIPILRPTTSSSSASPSNVILGDCNAQGSGEDGFLFDSEECVPLSFHRVSSTEILYETKKRTPKWIGKYLMGDLLGEGSYSKVKEVMDTETLQRRAVKIMASKRLRKIPNGEQNVQREIQMHRSLSHPNVVKLIQTFSCPEREKLYIIMEYCSVVLQEVLDSVPSKRLPIFQSADYFRQLMCGLEYLHGNGIIHKDIKPGNLLLTNAGIIKITDFGVSEKLDRFQKHDICQTGQGTPAFQAPEVANGTEPFSGFKVDVWSSGVTLFNITTGQYPFQGESIYKLFENIGRGSFSIPEEIVVDEHLTDLIQGSLRVSPRDRFSVDEIRRHRWLQKKHSIIGDVVSIPAKSNSEGDQWRSTTVLPYLHELYDPSLEVDDMEDGLPEEFEGIQFESCPRRGDQPDSHEHHQNGNNNEVLKKLMETDEGGDVDTRRGKEKRRYLFRNKKTSSAGRFLSCLGVDSKCKPS